MKQENILLARQPIYDNNLNIFAYELLFRTEFHADGEAPDADEATSLVLFNAFSEIGINNVVGEHPAFINFTRNLIITPPPFASGEIVIEVLEDIAPDPEVVTCLKRLKQLGYTIALDDFQYRPALEPFVALADIIKIDVLALTGEQLQAHAKNLKREGIKLLAEKVETQEMYDTCKALGFDYFQGFFLSRPKAIKARKVPANKLVVMALLADLQKPDVSPQDLHDTISKDPRLSLKLLRMVNSAAYRRPTKIESLYRAILLIGQRDIRLWASLLALSSLDEKPHALAELTIARAKMCEFLGEHLAPSFKDLFFTVGLFSMLEAYFDMPLEQLLNSLSLTDEINRALLYHEGIPGFILKTALAYEQGDWGQIDWAGLQRHHLSIQEVKQAYLDSLQWSQNQGNGLLPRPGADNT